MIFRLVCLNGMVAADATRSYHVGKQVEGDEENRVFKDATLKLDDEAFFAKLGDVVRAAVDETCFNQIVVQMREAATGARIEKPKEAIEKLSQRFVLTDSEGESVFKHLIEGHDLSAYGVVNALTRASQDMDSYERATDLEVFGGEVLAMAGSKEWEAIAS